MILLFFRLKYKTFGSELKTTWIVGDDIRFKTVWEDKIFEQ
jgi:hypothetical protein